MTLLEPTMGIKLFDGTQFVFAVLSVCYRREDICDLLLVVTTMDVGGLMALLACFALMCSDGSCVIFS